MQSFSILKKVLVLFLFPFVLYAGNNSHPFNYDLHYTQIPGITSTIICFHGMGGDYRIASAIKKLNVLDETLISFNFPDHGIRPGAYDPELTTFGTIHELLPAIYVLKKAIIDEGIEKINLYCFSAGGGAIINMLAVLNTSTYDPFLKTIGIEECDKAVILQALERGWILLDSPLKSLAEMIDFRGSSKELEIVGRRYRENNMEPIDSLGLINNLALHFIVHFQNPDEILSNRDDGLFFERLKKSNHKGTSILSLGKGGGHNFPHPLLWKYYNEKK